MSFLRDATNAYFEGKQPFEVARATALAVIAGYYGLKAFRAVRRDGLKKALTGLVMSAVKSVPGAKGAVEKEQKKILDKMESLIIPKEARQEKEVHTRLPALGRDRDALMSRFQEWSQKETARWERGQVSGGIYHGDQKMLAWLAQVYSLFALSNPLHPDVFPYIRKMESEVVSMTLGMFHGYNDDDEASGDAKDQKVAARPKRDYCGVMTSGGTESIIMAMKAYRDRAAEKGITEPEIIICVSAHAAFNKAAQYFKMKIVSVPVDPVTMAMDLNATKAAVTPNTVVVVGSAISFPHGILDPIEELSALALKHDIGLHVDSCLGGFLLPFMAKAGYPLPPFDFRLPGVTTISADTHKYGYAPKGSSVLMYSSKALRAFQYFVAPDWMGGIYASPSMAGSRPGGLIASTWAALVSMGEGGYVECTRAIMESATKIAAGVRAIPGLKVMGKPCASVVAFGSTDPALNVFKVGEAMGNRHWNLNTLQHPASVHICCTYMHRGAVADQFVKDLADAVAEVRANPDGFKNGSAAIYGMAESVPDASLITDLAKGFLDTLYTAFPANAAAGQGAAAKPAAH